MLSVLDGAVLVISAVEGVQPQTRVLMRALQRLRVPTLLFVNKIDRAARGTSACCGDLRAADAGDRRDGLACATSARGPRASRRTARTTRLPARLAEVLAEQDESILAAYVEDERASRTARLRDELAAQTARALVHPVFFGSAITGAGVDALMAGIAELLPATRATPTARCRARVFKIERGAGRREDRLRPHVLRHRAARATGCSSAATARRR